MKPKNFPAKKNDRRIVALQNLMANPHDVAEEIKTLDSRITDYATARGVKTKKYRGGNR